MTLVPIIVRELQAESRRPMTVWLRVLGAFILVGVAIAAFVDNPTARISGPHLFTTLQAALVILVWTVVPLTTADCISRERREGTLPLLFLTPLRAWHIIVAKTLAQGLRSFALVVATLPVLAMPVLLGGVPWEDFVLSAIILLMAFSLALGAGILGSALARSVAAAIVLSAATAAFLFPIFTALAGTAVMGTMTGLGVGVFSGPNDSFMGSCETFWNLGGTFVFNYAEYLVGYSRAGIQRDQWALLLGVVLAGALAVLCVITVIAASILRRHWQIRPRSRFQEGLHRRFCTPVLAVDFLRSHLRRRLDRNPIVWLAQRSWRSRLVAWGWLALVISLGTTSVAQLAGSAHNYIKFQHFIVTLLAGSMALTAAGSFRQERETGVLELLLVSPLRESELIWGRLRGVIGQFLPAALVLAASWIYLFSTVFTDTELRWMWTYAVSLFALPVIGLYFALRCPTYFAAVGWTVSVGLVLPLAVPEIGQFVIVVCARWWWYGWTPASLDTFLQAWSLGGGEVLTQVLLSWFCYRGLRARLRERNFTPSGRGPSPR